MSPRPLWRFFTAASLLMGALVFTLRRSPLLALLPLDLLLGILRVEVLSDDGTFSLSQFHGSRAVQVRGVAISDPESVDTATGLRLSVEEILLDDGWTEVKGDTLVTLRESAELTRKRDRPYFRYGDRLLLEGALSDPPTLEDFDYPTYLARQGIGSVMSFPKATLLDEGEGNPFYQGLYTARRSLGRSLADVLPEPQASLGQALLLGLRGSLPEGLVKNFRDTGASHLLAISGLHIGVLMGIGIAASQSIFGRRRQVYLIVHLVLVWLYALTAGMSPSVARAAVMGTVYMAALGLGRPRSVLPALGFAAAVMVAISPNALLHVSFQLSFAAVAGIALWAEPSGRLLGTVAERDPASGPTPTGLRTLAASLAAVTIATLPLAAFHFHQISILGVPTTILALPSLLAVLVTQAAAGLVGLVSETAAAPFAWLAWLATSYLEGIVSLLARLPVGSVETGRIAPGLVWAYYGLLVVVFTWAGSRRTVGRWMHHVPSLKTTPSPLARTVGWWAMAVLMSVSELLWIAALSLPDGKLHIAFLDVGQGDAVPITTPAGKQVLVDGGPDPLSAVRALSDRMGFRDRTVELVVLTHPHGDHVTGLVEVLSRYGVEHIVEREIQFAGAAYQAWRKGVAEEGAEVTQAQRGQVIVLDDGVFIQVLNPPDTLLQGTSSDEHNASVVMRLVYGEVSFLLTGDVFSEVEASLVSSSAPLDSDVLKVAHHGSRNSSLEIFLDAVSPSVAIISLGESNRFGHPHPEVMAALRQRVPDDMVFLTRDRGTIEFITDGERLTMKTER